VYSSTDNGATWITKNSMDRQLRAGCLTVLDSTLFVGVYTTATTSVYGIITSTDNGATWKQISSELPITYYLRGIVAAHGPSGMPLLFVEDSYSAILLSTDNGANWTVISNGIPLQGTAAIWAIAVPQRGTGVGTIIAATATGIFASSDKGGHWRASNSGLGENQPNVQSICLNPNSFGEEDIFVGTNTGPYVSSNNGGDWKAINSGLTVTPGVFAVHGNYLFCGVDSWGVWKAQIQ
jgi:hypothetical protein